MSTAQLIEGRGGLPGEHPLTSRGRARTPSLPAILIASALLLLVAYAAFDHGAVGLSVDTRIEVLIAAIAAAAVGAWGLGALRLSASRGALAGVALLGAFACWCGITVLWSVAPDQTWIELNRAIAYVLVLCLAIAVGASHARAAEHVAKGFLIVALVVTAYGLGQKLLPGLHVGGLFDLNQTGPLPRLQEPLGYWNALAVFIAFGVPIALAIAADPSRTTRSRLAAACATELMLLTIGFTYSRGGFVAVAVAVAVSLVAGGSSLRSALWLCAVILATAAPLAFGLSSHALSTTGVSLSSRQSAGAVLALITLATIAALIAAGRGLLALEPRLRLTAQRSRRLGRLAAAGAAVLVLCAVLAVALSSRGLTGTITHEWNTFTSTTPASNTDPSHLLSTDSQNRWVWWQEAARALGARPLGGWGAGSFGVVHLLYRRNTLPVQQPHSVPLQFLAETGVVGAVLALAGFALLLRAAARGALRDRRGGRERVFAAALLGGAVAYAVHALYDWDWNIPAVTLPALLFIGVLAGRYRGAEPAVPGRPGIGAGAPALAAVALWLCVFAVSAALPSLAASKANMALIQAASGSRGALQAAQSTASLASGLDPLSDAGLRAEATIAIHQNRLARAREYLREAVGREPTDGLAWGELAQVETRLGDAAGAIVAARRVVALDPEGHARAEMKRYGP